MNSIYGLFQKTEMSTLKLLEIVEQINFPDYWDNVDLVKQTTSLMQATSHSFLVDDLLFVRKAQAIVEFCMECRSLLRAFKLDTKAPDGGSLLGSRQIRLQFPFSFTLRANLRSYCLI